MTVRKRATDRCTREKVRSPGRPSAWQREERGRFWQAIALGRSLLEWAEKHSITILYIQPGQPQQNDYIERYNRTVRHEWLDQYIIEAIEEAQDFVTDWLRTYNNERPNMGIGGITPAQKLKMAA